MNTQINAAQRLGDEISNVGFPARNDQVPPLEEDVNDDQASVNPPSTMKKKVHYPPNGLGHY